jgi:5-methyltetrahydropteroyltriglutamate--homocysteine methyltransferase
MTTPLPRVDHVGSLIRPETLMTAWRAHEDGDIGDDELRAVQDDAVRDVVRLQEDIGLSVVTDGEFRRGGWSRGFLEAVGAFGFKPSKLTFHNDDGVSAPAPAPVAEKKIEWRRPIVTDDYRFLKDVATATPKVTMPTPSHMHFGHFRAAAAPGVYDDIEDYWADMTEVFRTEIALLGEAGCDLLQLDEVPLTLCCDETNRGIAAENGEDPDRLVDRYIQAVNDALAGRPAGMRVLMHMCRGNMQGLWVGDGGYAPIAERLFGETDVDGFLLEYDSPRAGDFSPLRHLGPGKIAYLGIVSTKNPAIEAADDLKRRIDEAAQHADLGQLGVCPQCGFGSSAMSKFNVLDNPMTPDIQRAKLARLVEVAADVWGDG